MNIYNQITRINSIRINQHPLTIELHKENLFNYGHNIAEYDPTIIDDWNCIKTLLPANPKHAIDIGTKWGEWTRSMESTFDLIYCFEPNMENINMIKHNCILRKLQIYNCYAGKTYGNTIYTRKKILKRKITIPIDYINPVDVDLIRISANGNELAVIKGAIKTIIKYKPIIIIQHFTEAFSFLFDIGMQLVTKLQNDYYILNWEISDYPEINKELDELYNDIDNSTEIINIPTECLIAD